MEAVEQRSDFVGGFAVVEALDLVAIILIAKILAGNVH